MPDNLDKALTVALTIHRVSSRMTQAALAKAVTDTGLCQWTRAQVASLESGRRGGLRVSEVLALCIAHQITLADLLAETGASADVVLAVVGLPVAQQGLHGEIVRLHAQVDAARDALDENTT